MVAHSDVEEAGAVGRLCRLDELGHAGAVLPLPRRGHHRAQRDGGELDAEDELPGGDDGDDVVAQCGLALFRAHPGQTTLWSSE